MKSFRSFLTGRIQAVQRGISTVDTLLYVVIAAALIPVAISFVIDVNTTSWPDAAETLWDLAPLFIVIGVAVYLIRNISKKGSSGAL